METLATANHIYPLFQIGELNTSSQSIVKELQKGIEKFNGSCKIRATDGSNRVMRAKKYAEKYMLCLEYVDNKLKGRFAVELSSNK